MHQDLTIYQIRLFLKVAELRSISKASIALNAPQPSVSRLMARMESNLGATLLERSGRGVALTPAGKRFQIRAVRIVHDHDQAFSEAQETRGKLYGEVRIATPESIGDILFVPLIRHFRKHHPEAAIRVVSAASATIPTLIDNGLIDIGVITDTHARPSGNVDLLCTEKFYLVGPKDSKPTTASSIRLDKIAGLPLILNAMQGGFRNIIDQAFTSRGLDPNIHIEIDANDPLLDLILEGEGYSILPFSTIARKHQLSDLSASLIVEPEITRRLLLTVATGHSLSSLCRETARQIPAIMRKNSPLARWEWDTRVST